MESRGTKTKQEKMQGQEAIAGDHQERPSNPTMDAGILPFAGGHCHPLSPEAPDSSVAVATFWLRVDLELIC